MHPLEVSQSQSYCQEYESVYFVSDPPERFGKKNAKKNPGRPFKIIFLTGNKNKLKEVQDVRSQKIKVMMVRKEHQFGLKEVPQFLLLQI